MDWLMRFVEAIVDALATGLDAIAGFFRLFKNVIVVIADVFLELPKFARLMINFVADVPAYLAWLPGAVIPAVSICIIIAILWKIFGRT